MNNFIGQTIGRYHILEQLGEGGMAIVYKAFDLRLETNVAVKVIRTERLAPEILGKSLKRFEREAKSLAKLTHPNIVKVTDYGEHEGKPYLVMSYLPGGTLKERLKSGAIPWQEAVQLLLPIAHALEYAHEHSLIHRDVKPSNILLMEKGQPILTDFGVAKLFDVDETAELTGTGMGIGTPEYMAPEQWTGQVTHQTDIYALGVVLYEMMTGRKPYQADTPAALLLKQANDPLPRPRSFVSGLPDAVEKVLLKALAKNPEDRYQGMGEMAKAMEGLLAGKPVKEAEPARRVKEETLTAVEFEPGEKTQLDQKPIMRQKSMRSRWAWGIIGTGALLLVVVLSLLNLQALTGTPTRASGNQLAPTNTPTNLSRETSTISIAGPTLTATAMPAFTPTPTLGIGSSIIRSADGMVMMYVPAGEFTMGSDADDAMSECVKFRNDCLRDWFIDEEPPHQVYLGAYWIDETEVTNSMYALCIKAGRCSYQFRNNSFTRSDYSINPKYGNYPVMFVTWEQSKTYCVWAGGRLPTEAEWEKASRGTEGRIYPWGNQFTDNTANFCDANCSFPWAYKKLNDNYNDTAPVKSYEEGRSIYGVYDLAGNVWEWTSSLRKPYPYDPQDGREDIFAQGDRVLRGGSWSFNIIGLRASHHDEYNDPELWINSIGFRCAMTP